jgi:muramidase (phage lysozyme)
MKTPLAFAILAAGAAYLVMRQAQPAQEAMQDEGSPWIQPGDMALLPEPSPVSQVLELLNPWTAITQSVQTYQSSQAMDDVNVQAFLKMIRVSEGTEGGGRDPYAVCYGYSFTITDFSDHPTLLGHWRGKVLPDAMCKGAGFGPGCVSTAAGAYQFISSTWSGCKRALGLSDFGPYSQDQAAIYLIKQRGALDDVKAGRVSEAINKCRREWASLPGAGYGQGERRLADLVSAYEQAGGFVA